MLVAIILYSQQIFVIPFYNQQQEYYLHTDTDIQILNILTNESTGLEIRGRAQFLQYEKLHRIS